MITLILAFFAGKFFYDLAGRYHKSQLGFALLGAAFFFMGGVVTGFIYGIVSPGAIGSMDRTLKRIVELPLEILFAWTLYKLLERRWRDSDNDDFGESDILDQNLKS